MSIKASTTIGLPVISIQTGEKINTLKEVIYDGASNQVKAFVVDEKGWFHGAKIISMNDIQSIGEDAIMVTTEEAILSASEHYDSSISTISNSDNFLTKSEVITEGGKKLGRVTDIYFDFPSGLVNSIEVSEGLIEDLKSGTKKIRIQDIITIGVDSLIVKDVAKTTFEQQGEDQGLNKVLNDTKEKTAELIDVTKQKTQEVVEKSKEIAEDVKDKSQELIGSDNIQNAISKTQSAVSIIKDKTLETFESTKENIQSGKAESKIKDTAEVIKTKVLNVVDNTKTIAEDKTKQIQDDILIKRINNAIGKTIKEVTIMSKEDIVIAVPGDLVTHKLLDLAIANDMLETVLNNAS